MTDAILSRIKILLLLLLLFSLFSAQWKYCTYNMDHNYNIVIVCNRDKLLYCNALKHSNLKDACTMRSTENATFVIR